MVMPLPSPSRILSALFPTTPEGACSGAELVTTDGRTLPLVASTLRAEAHGGIARFLLEQRFENKFPETLRVTYRMPLPADGAVSGYAFDIGERTIKGVVDRKAAARERFEQAIVSGKTAALLEQERADIFTQQIGNIPPGEALVARITVDQKLAWLPEGEWELRFPTVIGPRYIGTADTVADVKATHVKVTDKPLPVVVSIELAIKDAITGGRKASSPSHTLVRRADGVLELATGARLDRDIVVRWPVATPGVGLSLQTARPTAPGSEGYGLLTIVPPAKDAKERAVARDLIVLLDTSGSMGGGPLDKAKQVVAMLIDSLDEQDRFELIEFSSNPRRYQPEPMAAIAKAKADAIKWVRSRKAEGGTEMRAAVSEALCTLRIGAQRQVVVVTDGYVGGEQQILEVLHHKLPRSCRLHVLGVGAAVNRSLATALARAGRGAEVIIGVDEDAERGAKRLLDRTRMPMLTNVDISGSALLSTAPEHIPDVFEGAPLVAALLLHADGGELIVRGDLARDKWEQRITVPARREGEGNQAIVSLYGRERVADLESRTMLEQVNTDIEALGLQFQISTRFTSWVAIDEVRRAVGPTRETVVPQEIPFGTRAAAFGLRGSRPMMQQTNMLISGASEELGGIDFDQEVSTGQVAYSSDAMISSHSFDDLDDLAEGGGAAPRSLEPLTTTRAGVYRGGGVLGGGAPPAPGRPASARPGPQSPSRDDASDESLPPPMGRARRTTDVDARPPRPTESQPMQAMQPMPPSAPQSIVRSVDKDEDVGDDLAEDTPKDVFAPAAAAPRSMAGFAQYSQQPPPAQPAQPSQPETPKPPAEGPARITQKTMSAPPPPPTVLSSASAPPPAGAPSDGMQGMAARKSGRAPELEALSKKRPVAPASRFIPFWLTVLILAALLALIAWWLAS